MSVEPKPKVLRNGESHKPTPMTLSIRQLTRSLAHLGRHFVLPHAGLNGAFGQVRIVPSVADLTLSGCHLC
jgi:hypothetical protein